MATLYIQTTAGTVAYEIDRPRAVIGPGQCDIVVQEPVHLALQTGADGAVWLTDLGPGNLRFNGVALQQHVFSDGDILDAAGLRMQVRLIAGAPCTMVAAPRPTSEVAPPTRSSRRVAAAPPPPPSSSSSDRRARPSGVVPPPGPSRRTSRSGRQSGIRGPMPDRDRDRDEPRYAPRRRRSQMLPVIIALACLGVAGALIYRKVVTPPESDNTPVTDGSDDGQPRQPRVIVEEGPGNTPTDPPPATNGGNSGNSAANQPDTPAGPTRRFTTISAVRMPIPEMDFDLVLRIDMNRSAEEIGKYLEAQYLHAVELEYAGHNLPYTAERQSAATLMFRSDCMERVRSYLKAQAVVDDFIVKKSCEDRRDALEQIAVDLLEVCHGNWTKTDQRLWIVLSAVYNGQVVRLEEPTRPGQAARPRNVSPLGKFQFGQHGRQALMQIDVDQPLRPEDFSRAFEINADDLRSRAASGADVSDDELQTRRIESDQALRRAQQLLVKVRRTMEALTPPVHQQKAEQLIARDARLQPMIDRAALSQSVSDAEIRALVDTARDEIRAGLGDD